MEAFLCFAGGGGTVELKTLQVHSLFSFISGLNHWAGEKLKLEGF